MKPPHETASTEERLPASPLTWERPEALVDETRIVGVEWRSYLKHAVPIAGLWGLLLFAFEPLFSLAESLAARPYWQTTLPYMHEPVWASAVHAFCMPAALLLFGPLLLKGFAQRTGGWRVRFRESCPWREGRRELVAIGLWSVLKLGLMVLAALSMVVVVSETDVSGTLAAGLRVQVRWDDVLPSVVGATGRVLSVVFPAILYNALAPLWGPVAFQCRGGSEAHRSGAEGSVDRVRLRSVGVLPVALTVALLALLSAWVDEAVYPEATLQSPARILLAWGGRSLMSLGGGALVGALWAGAYAVIARVTGGLRLDVR